MHLLVIDVAVRIVLEPSVGFFVELDHEVVLVFVQRAQRVFELTLDRWFVHVASL